MIYDLDQHAKTFNFYIHLNILTSTFFPSNETKLIFDPQQSQEKRTLLLKFLLQGKTLNFRLTD